MIFSGSAYASFAPVAIGGVGASGTRLVAQIIKELGFYLGSDLNKANDNLWFTLLFKKLDILSISDAEFECLLKIFLKGMARDTLFTSSQIALINSLVSSGRSPLSTKWLRARANSLISGRPIPIEAKAWGWKEPNTHIVIDRLLKFLPHMRYIHVVRNGLDMAHSINQNQVRLWGSYFLGAQCLVSPYYSLKYWCIVHRRVLEICTSMQSQFLLLNYDRLCLDPINSINTLLKFLEIEESELQIDKLSNLVRIPDSLGRFKKYGVQIFDPADIAFVKNLGFDTSLN